MSGRHDKAADPAAGGVLATGPIVVRGVTRGAKNVLVPGRASRHRARPQQDGGDTQGPAVDKVVQAPLAEPDGPQGSVGTPSRVGRGGKVGAEAPAGHRVSHGSAAEPPYGDAKADPHAVPQPVAVSPSRVRRRPAPPPEPVVPIDEDSVGAVPPAASGRVASGVGGSAPATTASSHLPDHGDVHFARPSPEHQRVPSATVVPAFAGGGQLRSRLDREALGVAVLALLAVVCAALIVAVVLKAQSDAAIAKREAANHTPAAQPSTSSAPSTPGVTVLGDESVEDAGSRGPDDRWPALLADALGVDVQPLALPGAGYATNGADGGVFVSAIDRVSQNATAVVLIGGAADVEVSVLSLARAASETLAAAAAQAPEAQIVVVGPLVRSPSMSGASFTALNDALRSAAAVAEVRFVDPVGAEWIDAVAIGGLSAAESRDVAARLAGLLEPAAG